MKRTLIENPFVVTTNGVVLLARVPGGPLVVPFFNNRELAEHFASDCLDYRIGQVEDVRKLVRELISYGHELGCIDFASGSVVMTFRLADMIGYQLEVK